MRVGSVACGGLIRRGRGRVERRGDVVGGDRPVCEPRAVEQLGLQEGGRVRIGWWRASTATAGTPPGGDSPERPTQRKARTTE